VSTGDGVDMHDRFRGPRPGGARGGRPDARAAAAEVPTPAAPHREAAEWRSQEDPEWS